MAFYLAPSICAAAVAMEGHAVQGSDRSRQLATLVDQQRVVAGLHSFIALARARLELFYVQNGNVPAAVLDEAGFLQSIGDQGNPGASDAEHLAQNSWV